MSAYDAYSSNKDAYGLNKDTYGQTTRRSRVPVEEPPAPRRPTPPPKKTPPTPVPPSPPAPLPRPASPIDKALGGWDWRQAIDKPATTKSSDPSADRINAEFEKEMADIYKDFNVQVHGDQPQQERVTTSLDVMAAANSGAHAGATPDAANRFSDVQSAYQSPENQAALGRMGGEAAYLTRLSNAAKYPEAPDEYPTDQTTGNTNTNVPGGSVQDAISQLAPGPGWDYNSSTGQWSAPGTTNSVVRTEAGGPNRAGELNYSRSVPVGPTNSDVPPVSNPIPNGVDWPELPKTPGLPLLADDRSDLNDLLNQQPETQNLAPPATPTPPPPPPPPPAKKEDEDYA